MSAPEPTEQPVDPWCEEFLAHLATDRGASGYTHRNYSQALAQFTLWHSGARQTQPPWATLQRDDFRTFLRHLSQRKLRRATIHLTFSALRTFYKFLIRRGHVAASPIRYITLPKPEHRLPKFLTLAQADDLLRAPLRELERERHTREQPVDPLPFLRDAAMLETLYSSGLRVSELCGLRVEDLTATECLLRVRGKGRKERLVPISEKVIDYARALHARLRADGFRTVLDEHSDKLGAKIRRAELEKVPYTLVIGQKEAEANSVSVRSRARGDEGVMPADAFAARLKTEVATRSLPDKKKA